MPIIFLSISVSSPIYAINSENVIECVEDDEINTYCKVEWHPHNEWLAVHSLFNLTIWDTANFEEVATLHRENKVPDVFKWSPDGNLIALGDGTYDLLVWNVQTGEIGKAINLSSHIESSPRKIAGPYDQIESLAWNNSGTKIAVSHNGTVSIWNLETDVISTIQFADPENKIYSRTVSWSPDSERLLVLNMLGEGTLYDGNTFNSLYTLPSIVPYFINPEMTSQAVEWNPDTSSFAVASQSMGDTKAAAVLIRNSTTGEVEAFLSSESSLINSIDWNPTANMLAVANGDWLYKTQGANTVDIWNMNTGELVKIVEYDNYVISVSWSDNGDKLAVATYDSKIHILEIEF